MTGIVQAILATYGAAPTALTVDFLVIAGGGGGGGGAALDVDPIDILASEQLLGCGLGLYLRCVLTG